MVSTLVSINFGNRRLRHTIKDKLLFKHTWNCCSKDMLNFDFLKTILGLISPPYFVNYLSGKVFLISYSINQSIFICDECCAEFNVFKSNYRKLAWLGFEPTTTEFPSDALTEWAIRPWVQLALRANFPKIIQFHPFAKCSHYPSVIAFVSSHICFKQNLAQLITLVVDWIDTYGFYHWRIFEGAMESWPDWDLKWSLFNSVQRL